MLEAKIFAISEESVQSSTTDTDGALHGQTLDDAITCDCTP